MSLAHLQLAHNMREEVRKLEEFRAKQKEKRKKVGQAGTATGCGKGAGHIRVTGSDVTFSDGAKDGRAAQTEGLAVQEDDGGR